uniref:RING-type E3 ubiquitin transferase n=2 Tax=Elaeis guineensis var. tenera TaxID=51953 RepID=A0A8N4I7T5_ELAGV|nr:putative E3 ubiquitin-protein ligase SINA-like 6 [Elaeis guineensis]
MEVERAKVEKMGHAKNKSVEETGELYEAHIKEEEENAHTNPILGTDREPELESIGDIELEESEEEGGRASHSPCFGPGNNTKSINVSIDPDVLDCSSCGTPLRAPLFECDNGHVACFLCCAILENKCHVCSLPIGSRRCPALETIIEAMKIPCPNSRFGCRKTIPYTQKCTHEESCLFAPFSCPISSCTFQGLTACLSRHIQNEHHSTPQISFSYNRFFEVALQQKEPFLVLRGKDGRIFLLLNAGSEPYGSALSIACMRPGSTEWGLEYKIRVKRKRRELHLKASPKNIRELKVGSPAGSFLVVPHEFSDSSGVISIDVLIRHIG